MTSSTIGNNSMEHDSSSGSSSKKTKVATSANNTSTSVTASNHHAPKSKNSTTTGEGARGGLAQSFAIMLIVCSVMSLWMSTRYGIPEHHHPHTAIAKAMREFKQQPPLLLDEHQDQHHKQQQQQQRQGKGDADRRRGRQNHANRRRTPLVTEKLAGLSCKTHGGPLEQDAADEMVYWSDIPSDAEFVSPFHDSVKSSSSSNTHRQQHQQQLSGGRRLYMTFEPDGGGWNNIRMAMETVLALAVAMGRTLVLPPEQKMYLLGKQDGKQRHQFSFVDFFPLHALANEHTGLDMITMEEFLEREAMTGNLVNQTTGEVAFPPFNRTQWDNLPNPKENKLLKAYLRDVTYNAIWRPTKCLAVFPASKNPHDVDTIKTMHQQLLKETNKEHAQLVQHAQPVDAPAMNRLRETLSRRSELCVYDQDMQQALVVHFMCYHQVRMRLLIHFYAFLFFEDWRIDTWMKRFIRDHVRYNDEIQCAAARIVQAIRARSKQRNAVDGILPGQFDSFHIRRGDFQFKDTRISAEQIVKNSIKELTPNATIYIATDERDKKFFDPLREHYDLVFMDDFAHVLQGINTNFYGMIDQLVASRGRIFFGCWYSTFTGYINRIRGYHSVKHKLPGYQNGTLPNTYYYVTLPNKLAMHKYAPLRGGFFNREFPTSWRDIDRGVGWLTSFSNTTTTTTTVAIDKATG